MLLRVGSLGDDVKRLQRGLNKVGSMLLVDGKFGTGTGDAISEARDTLKLPGPAEADDAFQAAVAALPDPFPALSAAGVTFIARAEVTSASEYKRRFRTPCHPSATSGITIGIGYDCQFATRAQVEADWASLLPAEAIAQLTPALGIVGSASLVEQLKNVLVPLGAAMTVFAARSLPQYLDRTRKIYPAVDTLRPAQRTALVSLVYNRGTRLTDEDPVKQERREMRAIQTRLAAGDVDGVADELESMTRLWDPRTVAGLIQRRRDEATMWRSGFGSLLLD